MMQIPTKILEIPFLEHFGSTSLPIVNIPFPQMGNRWFQRTLFVDGGVGSMLMNIHDSAYWPDTLENTIYS